MASRTRSIPANRSIRTSTTCAPEELAEVPKTPGSLGESLDALAKDHEFLLRGDVFTEDVINTWISYKQKNEVEAMALRPHPYEFCLYYDM